MLYIECPHCGHKYETEVFELTPGELFEEEECPNCGKYYAFEFEYEPCLNKVKKLGECTKDD